MSRGGRWSGAALSALVVASCATDPRDSSPALEAPAPPVPSALEASARSELASWRASFPALLRAPTVSSAGATLRVTLPERADGETTIEDEASGVGVRVGWLGGLRRTARRVDVGGMSIYPSTGILQRVEPAGVEDFIAFTTRPAREEVRYSLDVSRVAGLRLVERSLEALDGAGAPRLRVAPPFAIDATGARVEASIDVEGCAYDADPAGPWGRPVTPPGATRCTLRVAWRAERYPLVLDPGWIAAGLGRERDEHAAVKLASGRVLIAYGNVCSGGCFFAVGAELYDPSTRSFAVTGNPPDRAARLASVLLPNGKALVGVAPGGVYDPASGTFASVGAALADHGGGSFTRLASGKILVAGGGSAIAELYDGATNTFSAAIPMTSARPGHAAARLADGRVLLAGGGEATAEIYDPNAGANGAFTATGSMSAERSTPEAVTLASGKVLVVGGGGRTAELYDPATGAFTATGSLVDVRVGLRATLMPSGNVFVTGGFSFGAASALVERYEPASGTFTTAPTLLRGRGYHAATLLDTGALLVTGGRTQDGLHGTSLDVAEQLEVLAPGAVCAAADDCASGSCDEGTCCAASCTSVCHSCAAGTGACEIVRSADDPSSCTGDRTCDAAGACKKKDGRACAGSADCASGSCADGVCCDRACDGVCEACDGLAKGVCEAVAGAPRGGRACASDGTSCGGACDGVRRDVCAYPSAAIGCGTSCAGSALTARACDGEGACVVLPTRACPGNFACADESACRARCGAPSDCALGYVCEEGACSLAGSCDGDHRIVSTDLRSVTDCTPFRCDESNRCKTSCASVEDCTGAFACSRDGVCIAPPSGAAAGCAAAPTSPRGGAPAAGWGAGLALVVAFGWRRARARGYGSLMPMREGRSEARASR